MFHLDKEDIFNDIPSMLNLIRSIIANLQSDFSIMFNILYLISNLTAYSINIYPTLLLLEFQSCHFLCQQFLNQRISNKILHTSIVIDLPSSVTR
jgi:hypothetical protein